ncbi:substrate-binding domain-containing protein [Halomontanus rarus]|uniref:substrate-binding domain-containing protein n=1 Tax=Halomontanus rarus TaxID=3034020 RepID=UPI001A99A043
MGNKQHGSDVDRRSFLTYSGGAIGGSVLLTGYLSQGDDENDTDDVPEETLETALLVPSLEFTFFARMEEAFEDAQEELNVEGTFYDNRNDESTQASNFEDAVLGEPDFIMISPITSEGIVPSIELANDENIPVVTIDRDAEDGETATYVASDNVDLGYRSTSLCLEFMQEQGEQDTYQIVELQGTPGASVALERNEGFQEAVDEHDELEELDSQTGEFTTEDALVVTEDFITAHGDDIDGVFAQNDLMALGAQRALEAGGMDDVPITGIDGTTEWVEQILERDYYGTIAQLPEEMVFTAVEMGRRAVEGEDLEEFYPIEGLEVTQENAEEYLGEVEVEDEEEGGE